MEYTPLLMPLGLLGGLLIRVYEEGDHNLEDASDEVCHLHLVLRP
jgi:hypothetical protein